MSVSDEAGAQDASAVISGFAEFQARRVLTVVEIK